MLTLTDADRIIDGAITGGMIAPSPGAVLIRAADGTVLGAVGASGDTGDNDEVCVTAGLAAAGFGIPRT